MAHSHRTSVTISSLNQYIRPCFITNHLHIKGKFNIATDVAESTAPNHQCVLVAVSVAGVNKNIAFTETEDGNLVSLLQTLGLVALDKYTI